MIIKPKYINNVEVITPLYERFNDNSVKFYKTKYIISEKFYTPKITQDSNGNMIYPAMNKIYSKDNVLLFPKEFDYSKYRLLNEDVERDPNIPEYITVTETWGYTPTIQFNEPSVVSWQKPGMYDTQSTTTSANIIGSKFPIISDHTIYIDNADGKFKAGDVVALTMLQFRQPSLGIVYQQTGEPVTITSAGTDYIIVPAFKINIIDTKGTITVSIDSTTYDTNANLFSMFYFKRDNPSKCTINCLLYAKTRSPYSGDFPCSINSQFVTIQTYDQLLNLQPAWTVKLGGQDTDTLTPYTVPTITEYNSKVGTNNVLLAAAETLEKLMGDVFIIQRKYVKYQ